MHIQFGRCIIIERLVANHRAWHGVRMLTDGHHAVAIQLGTSILRCMQGMHDPEHHMAELIMCYLAIIFTLLQIGKVIFSQPCQRRLYDVPSMQQRSFVPREIVSLLTNTFDKCPVRMCHLFRD